MDERRTLQHHILHKPKTKGVNMWCVNVMANETITIISNNIKTFNTKEAAEMFLDSIKRKGLQGVDFDYWEVNEIVEVYGQNYDTESAYTEKCDQYDKTVYLVFASYNTGGHANTVHKNVENAIAVIEDYIKLAKEDFGEEVKIESVSGTQENTLEAIKKMVEDENMDNVFVTIDDGTWFTVSKAAMP